MPFIGGRFYMNPAYGRAAEHARKASAYPTNPRVDEQGSDVQWVTIDHRHVLSMRRTAGNPGHSHSAKWNVLKTSQAVVVYNGLTLAKR
jgi:hypothetical protein